MGSAAVFLRLPSCSVRTPIGQPASRPFPCKRMHKPIPSSRRCDRSSRHKPSGRSYILSRVSKDPKPETPLPGPVGQGGAFTRLDTASISRTPWPTLRTNRGEARWLVLRRPGWSLFLLLVLHFLPLFLRRLLGFSRWLACRLVWRICRLSPLRRFRL